MPLPEYTVSRRATQLGIAGGMIPMASDLGSAAAVAGSKSGGSSRSLLIGVAAAAVAVAAAITFIKHHAKPENRVSRLISTSGRLYLSKNYDESLTVAQEAVELAKAELPKTPEEFGARLHLAGVYSAMRQFEEALRELDALLALTTEVHGESMLLVPALHAKAEVVEKMDRPLAQAAEQLARARAVRRQACGENSMESAMASFNLASVLVRGAQEEGVTAKMRKEIVSQASSLALEACSVASTLGEKAEAAEFAAKLLDVLEDAEDIESARFMQSMRDVYLDATGEEWVVDDEGSDKGSKDVN